LATLRVQETRRMACVRAMLRRKNYSEDMWQDSPDQKNIADNIITALEVLGLWRPT
jgi:hypothetical protein